MDMTNYLSQGYFDENNRPYKELYLDWAQSIADTLARKGMSKGALRRFYGQVKGLQPIIEKDFEGQKHRLYPIIPHAHYGVNKENSTIPAEFITFIERNVFLAEQDIRHFQMFIEHFQCVVAYFRAG